MRSSEFQRSHQEASCGVVTSSQTDGPGFESPRRHLSRITPVLHKTGVSIELQRPFLRRTGVIQPLQAERYQAIVCAIAIWCDVGWLPNARSNLL